MPLPPPVASGLLPSSSFWWPGVRASEWLKHSQDDLCAWCHWPGFGASPSSPACLSCQAPHPQLMKGCRSRGSRGSAPECVQRASHWRASLPSTHSLPSQPGQPVPASSVCCCLQISVSVRICGWVGGWLCPFGPPWARQECGLGVLLLLLAWPL